MFYRILSVLLFSSFITSAQQQRTPPHIKYTPGLEDSLDRMLFNVPQVIHDSCIRGTVIVNFLVTSDGTIDSIKTIKHVHPLLDGHLYSWLFSTSGKWQPATENGVPVSTRITRLYEFLVPHISDAGYQNIAIDPLKRAWQVKCKDGDDYYKDGLYYLKNQNYEAAWSAFDRANRTDFTHLDAIDKLRKTADMLGKPCEVCKMLALVDRFTEKEIKRIRDQYCTRNFKAIESPATGKNTVYRELEDAPNFKTVFSEFLAQNINYPEAAKKDCIQGNVWTNFVVKSDGAVDSIIIKEAPDPILAAEAKRVILASSGMWNPGKLEGINVNALMEIPVTFSLTDKGCHDANWYMTEGEKAYEAEDLKTAFEHFKKAFLMDKKKNLRAGYNFAAVALTSGNAEEGCNTVKFLLDNNYEPAIELSNQFCK